MTCIRLSEDAHRDIDAIWDFIGITNDNPTAADSQIRALYDKLVVYAEHPLMGKPRADLRPILRSFPVGNYVVFYCPLEEGIEVVRILHGAQDIPLIFGIEGQ